MSEKEIQIKCSFCDKPNTEVQRIIAANDKVCICDECILDFLYILIYGEQEPITIELKDEDEISNSGC